MSKTATVLDVITGTPGDGYATARCFGKSGRRDHNARAHEGHGVTWKHVAGASIRNLKCPVDGGPLYQTTRMWACDEWTVIPAETIKELAKAKRDEKKAALQKKLDAGTHKLVRDLQPGDVIVSTIKGLRDGLVVEVEKVGAKYRVVVSRTRSAVAKGYLYHGNFAKDDVEARADYLEQLTDEAIVTGTGVCVVDVSLHRWSAWNPAWQNSTGIRTQEEWTGWASEYPEAAVAELWTNEVARWTRVLDEKTYARPVIKGRFETDEHFAERLEKGRREDAAAKAQAEASLQVAMDRLARTRR